MAIPARAATISFATLSLPSLYRHRPSNLRRRCHATASAAADSRPSAPSGAVRPLRLLSVSDSPVRYEEAWNWQHMLAKRLRKDEAEGDILLMLQHTPVYTLGTASKLEYVLFDSAELQLAPVPGKAAGRQPAGPVTPGRTLERPELVRTERGGEVTYHGPGQLVVYPIVNLNRHKRDLHWYLRQLEETVILLLQREYGIAASRKPGLTGVWVGNDKVAAMGLKVSRWVTMHGLAFNVDLELEPFDRIIPCGISKGEHGVTSLQRLLPREKICIGTVREQYAKAFCDTFGPYDQVEEGCDGDAIAYITKGMEAR
jgi:lipoyl(octanoyl) transferase